MQFLWTSPVYKLKTPSWKGAARNDNYIVNFN